MLHTLHTFITRLMSYRIRVGASCDTTKKEREHRHHDKHEEEPEHLLEHLLSRMNVKSDVIDLPVKN